MYNESKYYTQSSDETRSMSLYMTKVYGWMSGALFVTAICAALVGTSPNLVDMFIANKVAFWTLIISEVLLVLGISFMIDKLGAALGAALFILYAALNGITLSVVFLVYTLPSIGTAFAATAGTFGVMSLYGYFTKRDLTTIGNICFMGLIGIIIASIVNIFLGNNMLSLIISWISVAVFVGLTAYDTQKIKEMLYKSDGAVETVGKLAVLGALALYLDFVNLFLSILRIFGDRR